MFKTCYTIILPIYFGLLGCSGAANHCIYEVPSNVDSISAFVCEKEVSRFEKNGNIWQSPQSIRMTCESGIELQFSYNDGQKMVGNAYYFGGIPEEITILQKYELFAKPKLKAEDYVSTSRDNIIMEGLQACPSLSDALFE